MSHRKSRSIVTAFAFFAALLIAQHAQAQNKVQQAMALSQQTGRPILVVATATWCQPCQQLKQRLATDQSLQPILAEYICLGLDVENDQADYLAWTNRYRPENNGIPQVFIVSAQGMQMFSCSGAPQGNGLNQILSENLATAKEQAEGMIAAQQQAAAAQAGGVQADPAAAVAEQAGDGGDGGEAHPFGPLQEADEEPVAQEERPAPAVERRPPRQPVADEDDDETDAEESVAQTNRRLDGWLRMARSFADSRPEKTREYVQRILDNAPDSSQATQARALLRTLD